MNTVDQTFPGFVQACAALYGHLLPWAFILLLAAFIFEFWGGPPTAYGLLKFIVKLFLVVLVIANSNAFITNGQTFVQQWVEQNVPARPENVAARYQQQLALAQNAPESNQSFWSTLFSSNWFEAIIYAFLTLLSWLAMAAMYFIYAVQRAVLLVCWAVCPLLLPLLAVRPLSYLGLRHALRILAIMLWPVGNALAACFTDGLIGVAVDQNFLASHSISGSLGYGLQNLLAITVIAIWIIFSTVLAPAFVQKMVVGSPGAASAITQTASTLLSVGAPALGGAVAWGWQTVSSAAESKQTSTSTSSESPPPDSPPGPPSSPPAPWQPGADDPTGDKEVSQLISKLKRQ
ncbi:MAG: hypothetical protein C5B50_05435 [Verrucomicrobia bacterium]|nr:MAG: hypothetical protein C5B50_05435 [Verrucomicrobiota bacterium]